MLANTYILVLALFTVPISVTIVEVTRKLSQYRALRKSPAFHGCEDPPCENSYDPFGILKIISVTRHFLRKTALANFAELFQKHGLTYTSIFFGQKVILTCDPRNIKHLLITRFIDFEASIVRSHIFRPITEHGIFAVDGPEWKVARDMYRNQLSNTRTVFDLQLQEKHLQAFLGRICVLDKPYDIQPLFLDLTLDLTTAFAMGESVDSLNLDQPDDKQHFVDALLYLKKQMARYGFVGPIHVLLSKRDYYKACADVKRYVERFIVEALERKRQRNQCGLLPEKAGYNLLDGLTENSDDLVSLRDGLITILIAGIDSVAGLLSTTFWLLARNDDVFHKLRAEILDHIGQEPPSYVQLRNFSYLRNVLNEGEPLSVPQRRSSPLTIHVLAMRVYPPVPFNARIANKDTTLPHGGGEDGTSNVFVQRGQRVIFSTWAAHRSKQSFGDDALEFRPERWEHVKGESLGFIPFNSGPRACPGRKLSSLFPPFEQALESCTDRLTTEQYALMEASYVTVRILQTFSKITNCDPRPWKEKMGLNLFNEHGVVVEFGK